MSLTGEDNNNNNSLQHTINPPDKTTRPDTPRISYRECQKNHAAAIGGNVTDGCGEFMPSGDAGTLDALKCAACSCHRNFHRKEHHGDSSAMLHALHLTPPLPSQRRRPDGGGTWGAPVQMAFGATESSSEEMNFAVAPPPPQFGSKKRFRTKFTAEQKEKMSAFAVKIGWRIPREDDAELQRFCAEVGVKRQVFKVWMHNNKITSSKSTPTPPPPPPQQF